MLNDGALMRSVLHTLRYIEFFGKHGQNRFYQRENYIDDLRIAISGRNLHICKSENRYSF